MASKAKNTLVLAESVHADLEIDLKSKDPARIVELMTELDMTDTHSVIYFGTKAQEKLSTISDNMLEGVRNKDVGPAGAALGDMVQKIRDLDVKGLDLGKKQGFFAKLFGWKTPLMGFLDRYDGVKDQIGDITDDLERHKTVLLKDIEHLDRLYDSNLDYFHDLELYIAAGQQKLAELDEKTIPALHAKAEKSGDMVKAQEARDLRAARDDLERRVHDLLLTRQVTMQSLPSIRLLQENDKALVTKINSTVANTVPLWRQQLAQAVTIYRSGQTAEKLEAASDLTNDLLIANAENLKEANVKVREQIERGIFDIEAVEKANNLLIETIDDSLRIADEGKAKRREAEATLAKAEVDLKEALLSVKARVNEVEEAAPTAPAA